MIGRIFIITIFTLTLFLSSMFDVNAQSSCSDVYEPVCGGITHYSSCSFDGVCASYTEEKTYSNSCELGKDMAGARILYEGVCGENKTESDQSVNNNSSSNTINTINITNTSNNNDTDNNSGGVRIMSGSNSSSDGDNDNKNSGSNPENLSSKEKLELTENIFGRNSDIYQLINLLIILKII